jgi:hypothetical protein
MENGVRTKKETFGEKNGGAPPARTAAAAPAPAAPTREMYNLK